MRACNYVCLVCRGHHNAAFLCMVLSPACHVIFKGSIMGFYSLCLKGIILFC